MLERGETIYPRELMAAGVNRRDGRMTDASW